jgi:3-oxoacyl-[acyl-carrier protein] reductase
MSRIVLVTGANRGIGLAIARAFHSSGDQVIATFRSEHPSDPFHWLQLEVNEKDSVDRLFDEIEKSFGPVEVLIANAGITRDGLILRMSESDFDDVVGANLKGAFLVTQRAAKGMLKLKRGSIIFIGSVVAMLGSAGQSNYAATKAGLIGMARSLARELGSRSIRVNLIAPGFIETDMTATLDSDRKKMITSQIPLGRLAEPDEVAQVALFLAGESSRYITGAVIPVDGGLGMGN